MQNLLSRIEYHHFYVQRCCGETCCPVYTREINDVRRAYRNLGNSMTTYANSAVQYMNSTGSRPRKYSNKLNKSVRGRSTKVSRNAAPYKRLREGGQVGLWTSPRATEIMAVDVPVLDEPLQPYDTVAVGNQTKLIINATAAGSGFWQRRGRKIGMETLRCDFLFKPQQDMATATTFGSASGRLAIVYDRQSNGQTPTWVSVFGDVGAGGGAAVPGIWANPNLNGRDQYMILMDERFVLPSITIPATASPGIVQGGIQDPTLTFVHFKRYIKLKSLVAQYSADVADVGSIQSGALWVFYARDGADAASEALEPWRFSASIRLRFSDP